MNIRVLILFTLLTVFNVVLQTIKSLCTVKCKTSISALVNAIAYGLYVYVIIFTTSDGIPTFLKALITAAANYAGVYIANYLFNKLFNADVKWKVEISIPISKRDTFIELLEENELEYYKIGTYQDLNAIDWLCYSVFCPDKEASKTLKRIMPPQAKYNIAECIKRL